MENRLSALPRITRIILDNPDMPADVTSVWMTLGVVWEMKGIEYSPSAALLSKLTHRSESFVRRALAKLRTLKLLHDDRGVNVTGVFGGVRGTVTPVNVTQGGVILTGLEPDEGVRVTDSEPVHNPPYKDNNIITSEKESVEPLSNITKALPLGEGGVGGEPVSKPKKTNAAKKQKRKQRVPEDWQPSDKTRAWARNGEIGATDHQIDSNTAAFIDFHISKGSTFADFDRAYKNWMRNQVAWGKLPGPAKGQTVNKELQPWK